jgi:YfiH family protein
MIIPPGQGVAFTTMAEGDARGDRTEISRALGIGADWATVRQVHGASITIATGPGDLGEADGIATRVTRLPVAVFTADCLGVVLHAEKAVAVVHAGWRGAASGIVSAALRGMQVLGTPVIRAAIGPGIGPCCFEVGDEVAAQFAGHVSSTTWGTQSVDLAAAIGAELTGIDLWASNDCTRCGDGYFSHRGTATPERMAAIGWVP